ncbi:expressed unknown protein [Seminavis robusta]|uniref:Arf-GAP domain-containing protein n=1 Tax=Seminavis robusta TaxID=568900 RepID=A0A9N8HLL0_9STRA|nr:expressed unknown protein [Seminavis robusta]|eukprot:Sro691_g187820.1 n/a (407) ;mRNA; f:18832-20174
MTKADVESRVKATLVDEFNHSCAECDRPENKPVVAAIFACPVDHKRLAVVCCKKCHKAMSKMSDDDVQFTFRSLVSTDEWTDKDVEALEIGGNALVNACYEATVTNEKDGRDRKKYGYEAFLFEKYVNMSFFDEILYKQMMAKASKALVEKRFNQSLRGFNLKKMEDLQNSMTNMSVDPRELLEQDPAAEEGRGEPMERTHSSRSVQRERRNVGANRRRLSSRNLLGDADSDGNSTTPTRRRLSSRNLLADDEKKEDSAKRTQLSRNRMNSLRRDLSGGDHDNNKQRPSNVRDKSSRDGGGMRRALSQKRLSAGGSNHSRSDGMRRASSSNRLNVERNNSSGSMKRTSSRNSLHSSFVVHGDNNHDDGEQPRMRRASSRNKLMNADDEDRRRSGGRHRSSKRSLLA